MSPEENSLLRPYRAYSLTVLSPGLTPWALLRRLFEAGLVEPRTRSACRRLASSSREAAKQISPGRRPRSGRSPGLERLELSPVRATQPKPVGMHRLRNPFLRLRARGFYHLRGGHQPRTAISSLKAQKNIRDFRMIPDAHRRAPCADADGYVIVRARNPLVAPGNLVDGMDDVIQRPQLAIVSMP